MTLRVIFLSGLFFIFTAATAQKLKKADRLTLENLRSHVAYLADDKLEGRRAGTGGEQLAMEYISRQFKQAGLLPKGSDNYFQAFEINDGKEVKQGSYLKINGDELILDKEYFPFPFSAEKTVEATPAIAIQEADMPWFFDLAEALEENKTNPHFDLPEYIRTNAIKAAERGATAVIVYNRSANEDNLAFNHKDRSQAIGIPVLYVGKKAAEKYFADETASLEIKIKTAIGEKKRVGHNVIGFIDNGAPRTVVLGAHFDHLGYGEDGNSMLRTGEKLIHNGADDNASGTAALLELARILKSQKDKSSNYLFIAFSGEELGLYGSKYFTENPTVDLQSVNYMINMDMVGRLNDSTKLLAVGGFGTSPQWATVIDPNAKKLPFVLRIDSAGTGPSDHTSFYRKDIPVLFFFTGQHGDYHRPSDDAEKINYQGQLAIVNYIANLVSTLNKENRKLAFLKTREPQTGMRSFSVTMGIMPDYTYPGTGVRADGVTEGRPAAKAGLQRGDVIIQLGEHPVTSVETYMQALGKFKKGDRTMVKYKRGEETLEAPVQF